MTQQCDGGGDKLAVTFPIRVRREAPLTGAGVTKLGKKAQRQPANVEK